VATQTTTVIQTDTTNSNLAIVPNGTGAITASIPDGTTTGGNARGANAVDFQTTRNVSAQVASGANSTIVGGDKNTAFGQYSVAGGFQNSANGNSAVALGNQCIASGNASFCLSSEANSSGSQSVSIGRQTKSSGNQSMALGFTSDTNGKAYANVYGGGGKANNEGENIFSNSRRQIGEANVVAGGFYQRRHNIVGLNSRTTGTATPELFYTSGQVNGLSNSFTNFAGVGLPTIYTPLYDNVYFKIEAEIIFAVNAIVGTATGISVGDYKICKLEGVGRRFGGVNSVLLSNLTVIEESVSLSTINYNLNDTFGITFTNATFLGGGSLDITTMADCVISEMKMNL
jgi:hypothetical protein